MSERSTRSRLGRINVMKAARRDEVIASPKRFWVGLRAMYKMWSNRRQVRRLLEMDDHTLKDIGLRRRDIFLALSGPRSENPSGGLVAWRHKKRYAAEAQRREARQEVTRETRAEEVRSRIAEWISDQRRSSARILIVPGLGGSGADHWQSHWASLLPHAHLVHQDDWTAPDRDIWVERLNEMVDQVPDAVVVAHSLGCAVLAHLVRQRPNAPIAGALVVCPADVDSCAHTPAEVRCFSPMPLSVFPFPVLVVASEDDPYVTVARAKSFAAAWQAGFASVGPCGHINTDTGYGPWPQGLLLLKELVETVHRRVPLRQPYDSRWDLST